LTKQNDKTSLRTSLSQLGSLGTQALQGDAELRARLDEMGKEKTDLEKRLREEASQSRVLSDRVLELLKAISSLEARLQEAEDRLAEGRPSEAANEESGTDPESAGNLGVMALAGYVSQNRELNRQLQMAQMRAENAIKELGQVRRGNFELQVRDLFPDT
jgi:septal ring factor EnvC (AmiA/AmiB activator)